MYVPPVNGLRSAAALVRPAWAVLCVSVACESPPESAGREPAAEEPWPDVDAANTGLLLDAATLSVDLQAHVQSLLSSQAADPVLAFEAAMLFATDSCPQVARTETEGFGLTEYFDGLCETGGVVFKGPAILYTWNEERINPIGAMDSVAQFPSELLWTGRGYNGQTDIFSLAGPMDYNCSCTMISATAEYDESTHLFLGVTQGTAHWTAEGAEGTWLQDAGFVPDFLLTTVERGTGHGVEARGTLSGVGERYTAALFDLTLQGDNRFGSWSCGEGNQVEWKVRDSSDSSWATFTMGVDEACGACGVEVGFEEVCIDLVPLLDWEGEPW